MSQIPRGKNLDGALALLSDGYTFISKRCHRYQSDIFETRLMLQKVVCVTRGSGQDVLLSPCAREQSYLINGEPAVS
jgi:hypothetical protein